MAFIPTGKRILVEREKAETKKNGILLLENEVKNRGIVWATGRDCKHVDEGDYVIFSPYAGVEIEEGKLIMSEDDVFCIIEE